MVIKDSTLKKRDVETRVGATVEIDGCEKEKADYRRFVDYMNEKALSIGMTSSHFNDAAGMNNISCARDLLRLAAYVKRYPILDKIWSTDTYTSRVLGPNERTRESVSKSIHPDLDDHYRALGRKGGTLRSSTKNLFVYNLISVLEIPDSSDQLLVVVMYAHGDNNTPENRFRAAKQIADIAISKYKNPEITFSDTSVCCENAIAAVMPAGGGGYDDLRILYEKDADMPGRPMSVSKILTAICVLDHIDDRSQTITYHEYDTDIGGFYVKDYFAGDSVTYEDALYVMMLESSNVTAQALGRAVGEILNKKRTVTFRHNRTKKRAEALK